MNSSGFHIHDVEVAIGGFRLNVPRLVTPSHGIVGITGPNGAGKSTLLGVLAGLHRLRRGKCVFAGHDLTSASMEGRAARGIGRLPQRHELPQEFTVLDCVTMAAVARRLRASSVENYCASWRTVDRVPAMDVLKLLNKEVADSSSRAVGKLSYGQQRVVALACAMMTGNAALLLDEPFQGIAEPLARHLLACIREWANLGRLVVLVEHDRELLRAASDVVVTMNAGTIVGAGQPRG